MKVLGTEAFHFGGKQLQAMRDLGYKGTHGQFRIICKCKSTVDANRKCAAAGLGGKIFRSGWCTESGNETELATCEHTDIAFCICGTYGNEYATIEQLNERVEAMTDAV